MTDVQDLITDIASIVTSVRPREVMTLKRIETDFKAIYGHSIPFYEHGFSSLTDLLESFPNHFKFSMADGMLVIRTNVRNNITALIAKEKNSKKPKCFPNNSGYNTSLFKKHKRRDMQVETELPGVILKGLMDVVGRFKEGMHKARLLTKFKEHVGYECKYLDYGFADEAELLRYLNGRVLNLHHDIITPIQTHGQSLFDLLKDLLSTRTGYTLSSLQEELCADTATRIPIMMKAIGHVNFVDVIYDGHSRGILSYDHDLVYSPTERRSLCTSTYPEGVSYIKVVRALNPSQFTFEIVSNESLPLRSKLHDDMQQFAPNEPLLSMFKDNRHCSIEYDGEWYRAMISNVCCDKMSQSVTVHFIDFPIEMDRGIDVSLPTDRLRFVPHQCEEVPAFVHRGAMAYICSDGGRQWSAKCCDTFSAMVTDTSCVYQSYLVAQTRECIMVDIVVWTKDGERLSLFQRLIENGMAQSTLHLM